LGLPAVPIPKDNAWTAAKAQLGKQLYFDPRLSRDNTVSCASCHDPKLGYSNGAAVATGIDGQKGGRSAPTVVNTAYGVLQFWDGRASGLEDQALGPVQNPIEMNLTLDEAVARLSKIPGYQKQFQAVFGTPVTSVGIARAIASYERTILCGNSPYDKYMAGDKSALSAAANRGRELFFGKAHCSACHSGPNFTDNGFHNLGVGMDQPKPDEGRAAVSGQRGDTGAFKTPTCREVARTAPYMHDGSLKTLEDVVEHYNKGGVANPYLDEEIYPLNLTDEEKQDLIAFMTEGLSSADYPNHQPPKLPE
jgi:cytochrome c peroxidase